MNTLFEVLYGIFISENEDENYFLVTRKTHSRKADDSYGQKRLTTLTILFSVLADNLIDSKERLLIWSVYRRKRMEKKDIKNREHIRALNRAYLDEQLVIFVGAGLSIPLNLPSWQELINQIFVFLYGGELMDEDGEMVKHIKDILESSDFWDGIESLQNIYDISELSFKNAISKVITECEEASCPRNQDWGDNNYFDLSKLHIKIFLTTNYDSILFRALGPDCERINVIDNDYPSSDKINVLSGKQKIFYIHGTADDYKSIIISKRDVEKIYIDKFWTDTMGSIFSTSKLLFIGVSFEDIYLQNFIKTKLETNENSIYAIAVGERYPEDKFPGSQIIIRPDNPVKEIRDILEQIARENDALIFIRVSSKLAQKEIEIVKQVKSSLKKELPINTGINHYVYNDYGYILFNFLTYKTSEFDVKAYYGAIQIVLNDFIERGLINENYVVYISYNLKKVSKNIGKLTATFENDIRKFLFENVSDDSHGFVIDKIGLDITEYTKEWIQSFIERKGIVKGTKRQFSIYVEESIKTLDAQNAGVEVHVAGVAFFNNRILLEKRDINEAVGAGLLALPGGKILKSESFEISIIRVFKEKYGIDIDNPELFATYSVYATQSPGLAFWVNISNKDEIDDSLEFYDYNEIKLIEDKAIACERGLLEEAFNKDRRLNKEEIKLRIILYTKCNYNCKCCHHENISEEYEEPDIDKIITNLKKLHEWFEIKKISITGGEPLLPKYNVKLLRLISFIRTMFETVDLSIITNGYYLNESICEQLHEFDVRYKISLYGYDTNSFLRYAGLGKESYEGYDYIDEMNKRLLLINRFGDEVTINIPVNSSIKDGLYNLLNTSSLREILIKTNAKVKLIEMVKPRRGKESFDRQYISADEIINTFDGEEHVVNDESSVDFFLERAIYYIHGVPVSIYVYPCKTEKNCKKCFNHFGITMKPNGEMLICSKAIDNNKRAAENLRNMGIDVEDVDLGKEYELYP